MPEYVVRVREEAFSWPPGTLGNAFTQGWGDKGDDIANHGPHH